MGGAGGGDDAGGDAGGALAAEGGLKAFEGFFAGQNFRAIVEGVIGGIGVLSRVLPAGLSVGRVSEGGLAAAWPENALAVGLAGAALPAALRAGRLPSWGVA